MNKLFWLPWLALPAMDGEDPREGKGACCFRMTEIVRLEMGLSWPIEHMDRWYALAQQGEWKALRADWDSWTAPCLPIPGSITLLERDPLVGSFGLGVMVDPDFVLTTTHRKKVVTVPRPIWKDWEFREPTV